MKDPREDDERLSALLEGRVEGRQRDDLLAHLAEADDDYEVFTNTAAVLRALDEEDLRARRGGRPPSMGKRGWPSMRTVAAVASAVVLLLAAGLVVRGRGAGYDPLQAALRARAAPGWSLWNPLSTMRGGDTPSSRDARSVYAGAMLVDLAVAARSSDAATTRKAASLLIDRIRPTASASAPLRQIESRSDLSPDSLNALVARATTLLTEQLERRPLELGAWAEAARLAAGAHNLAFFVDGASAGMLGRAQRVARGDKAALAAVARVRAALPRNGSADWPELENALNDLLTALVI